MDEKGNSPLYLAADAGHVEVVTYLVDRGANVLFPVNDHKFTPIHVASLKGHVEVTRLLVRLGADVNARAILQNTPLHLAVQGEHIDAVRLLKDSGADLNTTNNNGETPLHVAAKRGHLDAVVYLVDVGADFNLVTKDGMTPMDLAAEEDHMEIVDRLVERDVPFSQVFQAATMLRLAKMGKPDAIQAMDGLIKGELINDLEESQKRADKPVPGDTEAELNLLTGKNLIRVFKKNRDKWIQMQAKAGVKKVQSE